MRAKLKMLRRIQVARERIRDVAAAEVAVAERERRYRDEISDQTGMVRQQIIDESEDRLNTAHCIADIEKVALEMFDADRFCEEAQGALQEATRLSHEAAVELRSCERDVRRSERLVDDMRREVRKSADRQEQSMVDDIIASRWSGS